LSTILCYRSVSALATAMLPRTVAEQGLVMRWSIRTQVLVPVLALLLGVVGLGAWMAYAAAQRAVRQQVETQVRNMASVLGQAQFPLTQAVLEQVKGLTGAEFVLIRADGGRLATGTIQPEELPHSIPVADDWQTLRLGERADIGGQTYLCSGVRLKPTGGDGSGTLLILYPQAQWQTALNEAVRPALWIGLAGGALAVVLAVIIAQRLSRRIQELQRRTRLIAAGDFSPMPLTGWHDELRDLAHAVNEMAGRLAQLQDTVQKTERLRLLGQLGGGLAHQLRNGVTGARLAVQVFLRECPTNGDHEALDVALTQLALVESGLRRFLDLGQADQQPRTACSVRGLIDETVGLLAPQFRHHHVTLTWQPPVEDATVIGNAGQLGHLLLNVLTNALEAAGPHGWVEVRMSEPSGNCLIEVLDSGTGPPPELADRLFEPFVTGKPEGIGLGLMVAKQVAEAHGGRIGWEARDGTTCFRITLPARPEAGLAVD
jgi:signal transduction histidine kinase